MSEFLDGFAAVNDSLQASLEDEQGVVVHSDSLRASHADEEDGFALQEASCETGFAQQGQKCVFNDVHGARFKGHIAFDARGNFDLQEAFAGSMAEAVLDEEFIAVLGDGSNADVKEDVASIDPGRQLDNVSQAISYTDKAMPYFGHGLKSLAHVTAQMLQHLARMPAGAIVNEYATEVLSAALITFGISTSAVSLMAATLSLPFITVMQYGFSYVTGVMQSLQNWSKSLDFALVLTKKSDCLSNRVTLSHATQLNFGSEGAKLVCSVEAQALLKQQMLATNAALRKLLSAIGHLGRCLYPGGNDPNRDSKTNCLAQLKVALKVSGGKSGILLMILQIANLYGTIADETLGAVVYGRWVGTNFQLDMPRTAAGKTRELLQENKDAPPGSKRLVCLSLLATQRAFEQVFGKLELALEVWVRSYGRALAPTMSFSYPCRKAIASLEVFEESGMCKNAPSSISYPGHSNMGCG